MIIKDLKNQLKVSMIEGSNMRMSLEDAELIKEKEQENAQRLKQKSDQVKKALTTTQIELRKINEAHMKNQIKLDKQIEKNKSLDKNIDDLVADKVRDIIKEKDEALNSIYGVKATLEKK